MEEQYKNKEKGTMSGNSKEANNTLKPLAKTQQHESTVIEDSSRNILTESTAVLDTAGLSNAVACTTTNSIETLAYSRVTRPPHKRLKAVLREGVEESMKVTIGGQHSLWAG